MRALYKNYKKIYEAVSKDRVGSFVKINNMRYKVLDLKDSILLFDPKTGYLAERRSINGSVFYTNVLFKNRALPYCKSTKRNYCDTCKQSYCPLLEDLERINNEILNV